MRMSGDLLKRIDSYFKDLDVMAVHSDGEPLLGDIKYYVDQSVRHDFVLHMNTTGPLLSKELADFMLETRLSIRFSIHAGRPETYRKIMGAGLGQGAKKRLLPCGKWESFRNQP
jgi:MoaA/NifB/PqqE/SkfB family radical SAM enzyme